MIGNTKFYMDTFNNPFLELLKVGEKAQVTCSRQAVLVLDSPIGAISPQQDLLETDGIPGSV